MGAACQRQIPFVQPAPPVPVTLNIYDVGTSGEIGMINRVLRPLGAGAFHCGVEVFGLEWSFGDYEQGTGVFSCRPRRCDGHTYTESVQMGKTSLSEDEFRANMKMMEVRWQGAEYDLLNHNCCHFCDEVLELLNVAGVPDWVMKLANAGAAVAAAGESLEQRRRSLGTLLVNQVEQGLCCACDEHGCGKQPPIEIISAVTGRQAQEQRATRRYEEEEASPWSDAFTGATRTRSRPKE